MIFFYKSYEHEHFFNISKFNLFEEQCSFRTFCNVLNCHNLNLLFQALQLVVTSIVTVYKL